MKPEKILYTAHAEATGGRDGHIKSNDGALDMTLTTPEALGGNGDFGVNPEQLFAAGYAACFIGALKVAAKRNRIALPTDTKVHGSVGIGPAGEGFNISVALSIDLPTMEANTAQQLIDQAHRVCPYSNATRGNVDVDLNLIQ